MFYCWHSHVIGEYDYDSDKDYEPQDESEAALGLPADSRSIRDQLVDVFSCEGRPYGKTFFNYDSLICYKIENEYSVWVLF